MTTKNRYVVPDTNVELCRRTIGRQLLIGPQCIVRQTFLYCLAEAARKHKVPLYYVVLMANHYHILAKDMLGLYPAFMRDLNSWFAKAMNSLLGRSDKFWSGKPHQPLFPQEDADFEARLRYLMENPLKANLVAFLKDYPLYITRPEDVGRDIVIARPAVKYLETKSRPKTTVLRFEQPPEYAHLTLEEYRSHLREMVTELEREHRERREREGVSVVGEKRLREGRYVGSYPASREKWFRLRPEVAAKRTEARIAALERLKEFREAYSDAIRRFNEGEYDVEFPYGTWGMRRHGVCIAEAPRC